MSFKKPIHDSQLGYAFGWAIFFDDSETQFGLFLVSISALGLASVCWTALLGGNMDLAVVTIVINTCLTYGEFIQIESVHISS